MGGFGAWIPEDKPETSHGNQSKAWVYRNQSGNRLALESKSADIIRLWHLNAKFLLWYWGENTRTEPRPELCESGSRIWSMELVWRLGLQ